MSTTLAWFVYEWLYKQKLSTCNWISVYSTVTITSRVAHSLRPDLRAYIFRSVRVLNDKRMLAQTPLILQASYHRGVLWLLRALSSPSNVRIT